ncbi:MAG: DUF229 domain-containing protein, partial [Chlamydiae bacterium]|nr:DUF229 domain-containing protein [Chlamydiota bacterium]
LMDASIIYLFSFFLGGKGFDHIVTAFLALGLNIKMILLILLSLVGIPLIGVLLYLATSRLVKSIPWNLSLSQIVSALVATGISLILLELFTHPYLDRIIYNKLHKRLPFGDTFLAPPPSCVRLPEPLPRPRNEKEIKLPNLKATSKPNIYLFVIETLRRDFITKETAPHLSFFEGKNISFQDSYANSNWTVLSWFSIFHSDLPMHWTYMRDTWEEGSIPLRLLKNLGYKIHIYASPDLHYFNMDHAIFGKNKGLIDHLEDHFVHPHLEPCDRDLLCLQSFEKEIQKEDAREGNLHIFFLDSTHSEYSFPKDFPIKFQPIVKHIDYLTFTQKEIELVKNRYKNAISYIDSLVWRFFQTLQKENLYDSSIILITGDHGEEFYEEGALFHGTHINRYQTEVPIFFKFPKAMEPSKEATHIDLFPSVLHYLTGREDFSEFFDGKSIFSKNRSPYRVAVLQNGANPPIEFLIGQKENYLQLRFLSQGHIYEQMLMEVVSMKTGEEREGNLEEIISHSFPDALDTIFKK